MLPPLVITMAPPVLPAMLRSVPACSSAVFALKPRMLSAPRRASALNAVSALTELTSSKPLVEVRSTLDVLLVSVLAFSPVPADSSSAVSALTVPADKAPPAFAVMLPSDEDRVPRSMLPPLVITIAPSVLPATLRSVPACSWAESAVKEPMFRAPSTASASNAVSAVTALAVMVPLVEARSIRPAADVSLPKSALPPACATILPGADARETPMLPPDVSARSPRVVLSTPTLRLPVAAFKTAPSAADTDWALSAPSSVVADTEPDVLVSDDASRPVPAWTVTSPLARPANSDTASPALTDNRPAVLVAFSRLMERSALRRTSPSAEL